MTGESLDLVNFPASLCELRDIDGSRAGGGAYLSHAKLGPGRGGVEAPRVRRMKAESLVR